MEPKDMTRELSKQSDLSLMMRIRDLDIPRGTYWGNPIITELLRRLNEADALRKENAELSKDKERIDFLDDGNYGIDPRNIPGVMMNGRRFHCLAGRGDWNTLREAIDAARLAKECEAKNG